MKSSFRAWKRKQLDKALAAQRNAQVLIARVPHLANLNADINEYLSRVSGLSNPGAMVIWRANRAQYLLERSAWHSVKAMQRENRHVG